MEKIPFYMTYPIQNLYLAEMEYEKDMERMKELYPKEVVQLLAFIEKRCDELEHEGSRMYDENPDRLMMEQEAMHIYEAYIAAYPENKALKKASLMPETFEKETELSGADMGTGRFPLYPPKEFELWRGHEDSDSERTDALLQLEETEDMGSEIEAQHYGGCKNSWLCHLVKVLFQDEVYRRRCRHRRCNRWQM